MYTGRNRFDVLVELALADDVCNPEPDINALTAVQARGIIVTAVSNLPHIAPSGSSHLTQNAFASMAHWTRVFNAVTLAIGVAIIRAERFTFAF